jgi:hypothetical protein
MVVNPSATSSPVATVISGDVRLARTNGHRNLTLPVTRSEDFPNAASDSLLGGRAS